MYKKIFIKVGITVPVKATHFCGNFGGSPSFYYMSIINQCEHWWVWDWVTTEWVLSSHTRPSYAKKLPDSL